MFDKVSGEIKNLNLAGTLTLTDEGAPLVNTLVAGGKLSGCTNEMTVSFEAADHAYVGGLVKIMTGGVIENCTNNGPIMVKVDVSAADKNVAVAGVVAQINAPELDVELIGCRNTAELTVAPVSAATDAYGMKVAALGGVAAWLRDGKSFTIDNCDNSGKVHFSSEFITSTKGTKAYAMSVGGVIGLAAPIDPGKGVLNNPLNVDGFDLTILNCDNRGLVANYGTTYAGSADTNVKAFTGGLVGAILGQAEKYASVTSCTNTGNILTYDFAGDGTSARPGFCCVAGGFAGFGGWLDMEKCMVNCTVGSGKRATVAIAGVLGFAMRPFILNDSDVFYTGYFRCHSGYAGNRAVIAVVPVLYNKNAMKMVPEVKGTVISNSRIGAVLNTADTYPGTSNTSELKTDKQIFTTEDDALANLVCGQGYTTVADDVTVSGFTYWNGI